MYSLYNGIHVRDGNCLLRIVSFKPFTMALGKRDYGFIIIPYLRPSLLPTCTMSSKRKMHAVGLHVAMDIKPRSISKHHKSTEPGTTKQ
jgi:hypothetical protein